MHAVCLHLWSLVSGACTGALTGCHSCAAGLEHAALTRLQGDAAFKHCRKYLPQKNWGVLEQARQAIYSTLPFLGRPGGEAASTSGPSGPDRPLLLCSGCGMRSVQLNKCAACKQAAYCRLVLRG